MLGTITIKSGSSPKAFTFNISNVKQLSFVSQGSTSGDSSCMNGFGNIMVYSGNKPKTFSIDEPSENSSKCPFLVSNSFTRNITPSVNPMLPYLE